ncbi:flagellar hook-basal body complex protein FliE [Myxococcota bacterium]|nr:flagellar hook-basal body complex protein FliE [Myxococcota bacterium]MBU1429660.1 flagellar hook-basal body complex protein FliE [Myxococcota bacterium]MBU1898121.1 flagellar hook-basal body complex protein FliE [Myxococcota bacterium]
MRIQGLSGAPVLPAPVGRPAPKAAFSAYLAAQLEQVNGLQVEADQAVADVATGKNGNIHEMMVALDKADVSFRMLGKVRSKVVEAYQEIMRMSI